LRNRKKGVLLHPQSGTVGRPQGRPRGERERGSFKQEAARMGRNERGSSESPVRPEGRWTESREGVAKKSLASRLEVSKKRLPLQPATQGAGPAGRRGEQVL
jgi:hypothetical protein